MACAREYEAANHPPHLALDLDNASPRTSGATGPFAGLASRTSECEHLHMNRRAKVALGASALVIAVSLAGCVAPAGEATPERTVDVTGDVATPAPTTPSASESPTPTPTHPVDPRDTAYDAEVAAWADPLPPGFAWPASISDLPAGRWFQGGDWSDYMSAPAIYHCMLVYAAWDAYFVNNDAPASKEYAARADATQPTTPDERYPHWLARDDGTIDDQELASQSGICNGFVGDLRQ